MGLGGDDDYFPGCKGIDHPSGLIGITTFSLA